MQIVSISGLTAARAHAVEAGRILCLIKLPIASGYLFTPIISIYADLLDPEALDSRQFAACLMVAAIVDAQLIVEAAGRAQREHSNRYHDPYRREYRADMRGALLEICARHLAEARSGFEAAGIAPTKPYGLTIG